MTLVREGAVKARRRLEWPTIGLIVGVYLGFALVTWFYVSLPIWLFLPLAVYIGGLYGHIQHEVIHGHPTSNSRLNAALIFPSIWLVFPYDLARRLHLTHHRDHDLTCPARDPESFYVTPQDWARMGRIQRGFRIAMNSFAGRLILSPPRSVVLIWGDWLRRLCKGDTSDLGTWMRHLLAIAIPLGWAVGVCGVPFWAYLLGFAYGGAAIAAMRSFLEHQAAPEVGERICVVESGRFFTFLFLGNNFHAVHHSHPGLAWYRIPARWRAERAAYLTRNGGYYYRGYGEVVRRYLVRPKEWPVHPGMPEREERNGGRSGLAPAMLAGGPRSPVARPIPAKPS